MVVDNKGPQDWVVDYNGERTTVASNTVESKVAMMAGTVKDNGCGQQR
jgi:hypothetical protein